MTPLNLKNIAFLGCISSTPSGTRSAAATDFINRIIAADVAAGNSSGLETAVQDLMAALVDGLISDGVIGVNASGVVAAANSTLKGIILIPGGQTLSSLSVPIVYPTGVTPQFFNFTSTQYNRKTGLATDGATTYVATNLSSSNAISTNNHTCGVYITTAATGGQYLGASDSMNLEPGGTTNQVSSTDGFTPTAGVGYYGMARNSSANYVRYVNGSATTITRASSALTTSSFHVYRRNAASVQYLTNGGRLAAFVLGGFVTQSLIAARLQTYINGLAAALP